MARRQINPKISVSVVYVLAMFMAIMDITIVNVAIPTIGRDFSVPVAHVGVVVTSFLVSLAVFIPASGWLGDRLGTKRVLLGAIAIFTVASALCGQAHSLTELVAFRILQGVGGGMITPVGMAMLYRTFPPAERVRAARILIIPTAFAPALGPVVGGLLVTELSWRWVFYVNVPIGAAAVVFGILFLHEHREPAAGRFDAPGFVLSGVGFASLMYAVSDGPAKGWASVEILSTGLVGAVLLALLVVWELRTPEPLLDLRLLHDRLFRTTTFVMVQAMAAFLGSLYLVALFFQDGLGNSALVSGLSTFPEAIGVMLGAQVAARAYSHLGPRRVIASGLIGVAAVTSLMTLAGTGTTLWYMRVLLFFLGFSMAHVMMPSQAAAFATISPSSTAQASGFFNANRQLASALGVALMTTVLAAAGPALHAAGAHPGVPAVHADLSGYHAAFLFASAIALVGAASAFLIHDADAAATMVVRRRKGEPAAELVVLDDLAVPDPA
jgi:EmrB/QacA subfamily drug resistance transporter